MADAGLFGPVWQSKLLLCQCALSARVASHSAAALVTLRKHWCAAERCGNATMRLISSALRSATSMKPWCLTAVEGTTRSLANYRKNS